MAMATCYPTYDMMGAQSVSSQHHHHHQQQQQQQAHQMQAPMQQTSRPASTAHQKDYSVPLFVDCSVEYELPNQAKPPVGARVEPLLMIHPCYFRKMESQRRSPFVNNMPNTSRTSQTTATSGYAQATPSVAIAPVSTAATSSAASTSHRSSLHHTLQQQQMQHGQMEAFVPRQTPQYCGGQQQQQPQYPQQLQPQSSHYATLQSHMLQQQRQHQLQHQHPTNHMHLNGTPTWDRFMNPPATSIVPSSEKSGKKSGSTKRSTLAMAAASCPSYGHVVEGGLPSHGRWESEKTSMAAIPRDYNAAIPEIMSGATHQLSTNKTLSNNNNHSMYRSGVVGKRDAMLSGGCHTTSNSNTTQQPPNQNYINLSAGGLWETDKSFMAAVPRDFQAAIPTPPATTTHRSTTGHSLRGTPSYEDKTNKYRQYLRSQRAHPYMMTAGGGPTSSSGTSRSSNAYTHMTPATSYPTMQMHQQVSCYNV